MIKRVYISICLVSFLFIGGNTYAQLPAKQKNEVGFRKSFTGGFLLHTQGLGINFNYQTFKTATKNRIYSIDFVTMKHPKEQKITSAVDNNAKGYVYGKLNSLYILRAGVGAAHIKYEKLRETGAQISFNWSTGLSLGMAKPEYLEVLKFIGGQEYRIEVEKYDPEVHNINNIYGRGPAGRGLSEMKFYPGAFLKGGINFEYSSERDKIRAIEVGFVLDGYPWRIPVMTSVKNNFLYPTFYLNLQFGKKFI